MAWQKVGRYGVDRGGPAGTVKITKNINTISIGKNAAKFWGLVTSKSANVYSDPDKPQVIGIEFFDDDTGDKTVLRSPGWEGGQVACKAVLREKKAKQGRYYARRDTDTGYIVVDLDSTYP